MAAVVPKASAAEKKKQDIKVQDHECWSRAPTDWEGGGGLFNRMIRLIKEDVHHCKVHCKVNMIDLDQTYERTVHDQTGLQGLFNCMTYC